MSHFLPFEAGFGGRSSDRLAKINERLKLGKPGRALNGDLWVALSKPSVLSKVVIYAGNAIHNRPNGIFLKRLGVD